MNRLPKLSHGRLTQRAKTTDNSDSFATRFKSRREILRSQSPEHLRRLALTAWDLGARGALRDLRLRAHAHTLGFAGQLITKSRSYSTTFGELRAARSAFRAKESSSIAVPDTFGYVGRGYDDPDAQQLAEVLFEVRREMRANGTSAADDRPADTADNLADDR